jgi:hypothetical protein
MRLRLYRCLAVTARGLMLAAALAFVHQGAMIVVSQAAAFAGVMPNPAVSVSGKLHIHDELAGNMHTHGGDTAPGHVHNVADHDDDDADAGMTVFWGLGCTSAVLPAMETGSISFDVVSAIRALAQGRLDGLEPDGLTRPQSTPSRT